MWLNKNLTNKVNQFGNIVLYIWLGTCDLTFKSGRFIELRHDRDDIAVAYVTSQIDRFNSFISRFPSVTPVFLEIPPYSIQEWNRCKGHKEYVNFLSQDLALSERIAVINQYISDLNTKWGVSSPRFKLDLLRYRKEKGEVQRVSLNFKLYKDGIHPDRLLARCWMKRLLSKILVDCI